MGGDSTLLLRRIVFSLTVLLLLVLSYFLVKPFLVALVSAFILAYIVHPLHKKISHATGEKIAAILSVILALVVILIPVVLISGELTRQAYHVLEEQDVASLFDDVSNHPLLEKLNINVEQVRQRAIASLINEFTSFLGQIPALLISMLIIIFGMYYILINWEKLAVALKNYLPFEEKDKVSSEIGKTSRKLMYGIVFVALIEFVVGVIGFYLVGVKAYILLPALIFLFAFIPGLGPVLVWGPLAIFYIALQDYPTGIGVIIVGLIISLVIEILLRNKLVGSSTGINPLVMLIGIIGGMTIFGLFGFIIGPLILVYTLKLIQQTVSHG